MKVIDKVSITIDWIINILAICAGVVTFGVMVLVSVDVIMRYYLNRPLENVFEITGHSLVFMTFLAAPWVLKIDQHVKMEGLLSWFSEKDQCFINFITSLLGVIICLVLFVFGFEGTWDYYERGLWFPGGARIPQYPILSIIVIAYFFLMLQFLRRAYGYLKRWRGY
jgi:TRAP-type mannitol/chloroaromatic compound transport system permease small subunit